MTRSSRPSPVDLDTLCVNTIRTLSMDAVQKANSGHPGAPMALAPLAYVLWTRCMRYNPANPTWFNRDRFILSNGHASMLQYAVLHLVGYDLSLDDLKSFRQHGSRTPGHPEHDMTPGIETTTGPLGQGVLNSVGMALAEAHLAQLFNRPGFPIVDHHTYAICSDGDLMEGASHEAASLAGHLKLGKLIWIYDDNHISIEGDTNLAYSDDVARRFESYGWFVQDIGDKSNDLVALSAALDRARNESSCPSLVIVRSHIGYGSPHKQDTSDAHGEPLGEEEIRLTKRFYGWPEDEKFLVPGEVRDHMRKTVDRGAEIETDWNDLFARYREAHPAEAARFEAALAGDLPEGWDGGIPVFAPADGPIATRDAGGKVLNAIAPKVPWLIGGSADLSPSTKTFIKGDYYVSPDNWDNRNVAWGIREHGMCGACNGLALHGGVRPYASTFFIFTDYARPSLRLAALMKLPVIYVMTHDSIGLGEDGPTHQPIEQLASLRAMPNMCVIRPADANETAWAWRAAMTRQDGPTMLVLTRQKLPVFDRQRVASAEGLLRGAYTILPERGKDRPDLILIATGSEVPLAVDAADKLSAEGLAVRVVSMPSWELFRLQSDDYRRSVLPPEVMARLAVEMASPFGWSEWVGDKGDVVGISTFGASAPYKDNMKHFGFTVDNVVSRARKLIGR